jgi:hypothetical protein
VDSGYWVRCVSVVEASSSFTQPTVVHCTDENSSLCQNCDWAGHGQAYGCAEHKRQPISCYSGCPSSAELSRLWSFVMEIPPVTEPNCARGFSLMSISEEGVRVVRGRIWRAVAAWRRESWLVWRKLAIHGLAHVHELEMILCPLLRRIIRMLLRYSELFYTLYFRYSTLAS